MFAQRKRNRYNYWRKKTRIARTKNKKKEKSKKITEKKEEKRLRMDFSAILQVLENQSIVCASWNTIIQI